MRLTQLVGLNSVPVAGVVWAGWSNGTALALYWCESAIAIFLVALRVRLHRKMTRKRGHWIEIIEKKKVGTGSYVETGRKVGFLGSNFLKIAAAFTFIPAPFVFITAGAGNIDGDAVLRGLAFSSIFLVLGLVIDLAGLRNRPFAWIRDVTNLALWRVMLVDFAAGIGMFALFLAATGVLGEHFLETTGARAGLFAFAFLKLYTDIAVLFPSYDPESPPRWFVKMAGGKDAEQLKREWREEYATRHKEYAADEQPFDGRPSRTPSPAMNQPTVATSRLPR